ncbi:MAG: RluA family pseudouridine synthase [Bdellovibrionota bacterium]
MDEKTKEFTYSGQAKIRLDHWLVELFPGVSRAYLQEKLQQGVFKLNGKKAKKGSVVFPQDRLWVEGFVHPDQRRIQVNENLDIVIRQEFDHYAVISKAAGIASHPNRFDDATTVANWIIARFPKAIDVGEDPLRPGIVHRLDTNTSGLMFVAKTQEGYQHLRSLFDARKVQKTYWALVLGQTPSEGRIDFPIAHHEKNPRKMVAIKNDMQRYRSRLRHAQTLYECVHQNEKHSLLRVQTLTGRMHQVRVHLSAIGFPLVGDPLYQNGHGAKDVSGAKRHFLHARSLQWPSFSTELMQRIQDDLPDDLRSMVKKLLGLDLPRPFDPTLS